MKINRKLRFQLLVQNWIFVALFLMLIVLVGYLTHQYRWSKDITQANRNILTAGSVNILKQMKGPVNVTVFATKDDASNGDTFRQGIIDFMARYQREKKDIRLNFINPSEEPKIAQDAGVKVDGEVVVEYQKRTEHITPPFAEQEMTNLLVRLSRINQRPIMFVNGHGERHLKGNRNFDYGEFGKQLEAKGFKLAELDLTVAPAVPANGAMLLIASPQVDLTASEAKKVKAYIESGGNVLWLLDDAHVRGLEALAKEFNLSISPNVVLDPVAVQNNMAANIAIASTYTEHAITKGFLADGKMLATLYPDAHAVNAQDSFEFGWKVNKLVDVAANGWLSGKAWNKNNALQFDEKTDTAGPINIGIALAREYGKKGQRVVVMGNANFLSNTYITNGGNIDLGLNIINWLSGDDNLITIQPMPLKDINIQIPNNSLLAWFVFHGFQYFIPLGVMIAGFFLWWKRRKA